LQTTQQLGFQVAYPKPKMSDLYKDLD